ncbi:hypothetical protein E2C01_058214 [Portunus trituberculatus]|uniref:Uncharacterized protein n=1 Tax=Portunus trituberculatus TaxID=210409 RepID=A0A5B7H213_PORTR|nr:hypothetical protein [Portunus trituberculatus]
MKTRHATEGINLPLELKTYPCKSRVTPSGVFKSSVGVALFSRLFLKVAGVGEEEEEVMVVVVVVVVVVVALLIKQIDIL